MSREKILAAVKSNQPEAIPLPEIPSFPNKESEVLKKYIEILEGIGGKVYLVTHPGEIEAIIEKDFKDYSWKLSLSNEISFSNKSDLNRNPHDFEKLDFLIIDSALAVAENSAIWVTDNELKERVLPFITQHLAVVIKRENIVYNMHEAYKIIGEMEYGFATFIAGPSKTADIEQSLVLGAHGPKTMTAFIL